jgi:hypothetical protein
MPKSKRKIRSKGKTGCIGVVKTSSGKYGAKIWINRKYKGLGSSYDTAKQAAKAYDKEAIKLRRPFSKLNYPKKAPAGYTPIQKALRSTNTVGYRGVFKIGEKKFRAQNWEVGGTHTHIGIYDTAKEAAVAYDQAVLKSDQSKTLLNFPDMVHNLDVEPKRKRNKCSSTTGYRGVTKTPSGKFGASIYDGKQKYIGTFDTAIQAALAYDQAAINAGKKSHTLNFPDGLPIKQKSESEDSEEEDDEDDEEDDDDEDDEDDDQHNDALEAAALMFMSSSKAQDIKTFMNISSSSRSLILKNWASKTSSKNWLGEFKPLFCKQSMPWSIGDDIRILNIRRDNDKKRSSQIQKLLPERTNQSVNTRFKLLQKLFDGSVDKYKTDTKSLRNILREY